MSIKEVHYGKTINIGNFQSIRVELAADVPININHLAVLEELKLDMNEIEKQIRLENNAPK